MTPKEMAALYEFNDWANRRVMESCQALTPEQFTQDLHSSFPSVRDTLAHIMGAEWVWLERFNGRSPSALPPGSDFGDLASLRARWQVVGADLLEFASEVTASELDRVIEYRNFKGITFAYPLGAAMQHLVNHGSYHRGQVATLLRQVGAKPIATDLLRYHDFLAGKTE
jgi:uncharacterized damage-inducible protein DinB